MTEYVVDLTNAEVRPGLSDISALWGLPVFERIVRCRDCKRVTIDQGDHDYREPLWCGLFHIDVSLDGFCKWGEPKEVDA